MSAEGIGMGGVAGVGGIATGGGIGIAAGISAGGGIGLEGGSIGIGSMSLASIGIAEIGAAPSFSTAFSETGTTVNSVMGVETAGMPFASFSLDTSIPSSEAPLRMSDYQVLWSASPSFEKPSSLSIAGPTESLTRLPDSTVFSETESLDGMFADIGNFMNQSPVPAAETQEAIFKDIDAFLHQDTTTPFSTHISIGETENPQDASLSAVEEVALAGLMTRIKHFAPATQDASSPSYDTQDEIVGEIPSDVATVVTMSEVHGVTNETAISTPEAEISIDTGNTDVQGAIAPAIIVEQEIEADRVQIARVLRIIRDVEEGADNDEKEVLEQITKSLSSSVGNQTGQVREASDENDDEIIQTQVKLTETDQEIKVETEQLLSQTTTQTEPQVGTVQKTGEEVEDDDQEGPQNKAKPLPMQEKPVYDHEANAYREGQIVKNVETIFAEKIENHEYNPLQDDIVVDGVEVAARLTGLADDEKAKSEIVGKRKDGSIPTMLEMVADQEFSKNPINQEAHSLVEANRAIKVEVEGPDPTEDELEKVFDQSKRLPINVVIFRAKKQIQHALSA